MNCKFVAEVASNHNGNLERCLNFIKQAKLIGCWGVKFQLFKLDKLFSQEALIAKPELEERKKWELPLEFIPKLCYAANAYGLAFGITPFDLDSVDNIYQYVDFYKIASYSILDVKLLQKIATKQKPIIMSTGATTLEEINTAINIIRGVDRHANLTVLHCVSAYPTPVEECNLSMIDRIRGFKVKTGWSDHSGNPAVIYRAVHKYNADIVEFHIDDGFGIDSGEHCWNNDSIRGVISNCNQGFIADGGLAKVNDVELCEVKEREWRADPSDGLRPLVSKRKEILYGGTK